MIMKLETLEIVLCLLCMMVGMAIISVGVVGLLIHNRRSEVAIQEPVSLRVPIPGPIDWGWHIDHARGGVTTEHGARYDEETHLLETLKISLISADIAPVDIDEIASLMLPDIKAYVNQQLAAANARIKELEEDISKMQPRECVNCGSENITISKESDTCRDCGYIYE